MLNKTSQWKFDSNYIGRLGPLSFKYIGFYEHFYKIEKSPVSTINFKSLGPPQEWRLECMHPLSLWQLCPCLMSCYMRKTKNISMMLLDRDLWIWSFSHMCMGMVVACLHVQSLSFDIISIHWLKIDLYIWLTYVKILFCCVVKDRFLECTTNLLSNYMQRFLGKKHTGYIFSVYLRLKHDWVPSPTINEYTVQPI